MTDVMVNYWAVIVAAVVQMVLGFLWYGPLFGKKWMQLSGFSQMDIEEGKKKGMSGLYFMGLLGSLVMSYVMAHFVEYLDVTTLSGALQLGFWVWLGFVATVTLSSVLWEGKSKELYMLNNAYNLLNLIITAAILALW